LSPIFNHRILVNDSYWWLNSTLFLRTIFFRILAIILLAPKLIDWKAQQKMGHIGQRNKNVNERKDK
jgi:hypothetical protein